MLGEAPIPTSIARRLLGVGRLVIGLLAGAVFLWLAIRGLDWEGVGAHLAGVSPGLLALALAVFLMASYIRAIRWRLLFTDESISIARLFIIQNEGIGLNNVLPLRVASEPTQLAVLTLRDGVNRSTAIATLGMERVLDVVASTSILALAFFLVPEVQEFTPFVWGAVGFSVVVVGLVRLLAWAGASPGFAKRVRVLARFTEGGTSLHTPYFIRRLFSQAQRLVSEVSAAVRDLERRRLRLFGSFVVSVLYWILVGVTAWIVALAIELPMSPVTATLVIMGTIFFATAVPAAPSAVGTFEWAVVYVLAFFGVERTAGFGYAVVIHAVFFLPPTIIAALFLPREGVLSFGQVWRMVAGRRDAGAAV